MAHLQPSRIFINMYLNLAIALAAAKNTTNGQHQSACDGTFRSVQKAVFIRSGNWIGLLPTIHQLSFVWSHMTSAQAIRLVRVRQVSCSWRRCPFRSPPETPNIRSPAGPRQIWQLCTLIQVQHTCYWERIQKKPTKRARPTRSAGLQKTKIGGIHHREQSQNSVKQHMQKYH